MAAAEAREARGVRALLCSADGAKILREAAASGFAEIVYEFLCAGAERERAAATIEVALGDGGDELVVRDGREGLVPRLACDDDDDGVARWWWW